MTDEERYYFDLQGFLVVKGAIEPDAIEAMNAIIDARQAAETEKRWSSLLTWGPEFLSLIDNPRVLPYLIEVMGPDLRLDHDYAIFTATAGGLHGGGTPYDPAQYYHCYHGQMYSGLTVASYALRSIPPGGGGFACIPGSHKSNFPLPKHFVQYLSQDPCPPIVEQIPVEAGDCIIFTEALTHGTLPWKLSYQRRSLFYKYSPKHMSWAKRYYFAPEGNEAVQQLVDGMTEAQRILLDPPSVWDHRRQP
jgi:hypothetical protein